MSKAAAKIVRRMRPLLGTYVEVGMCWAENSQMQRQAITIDAAFDAAFKAMAEVQAKLSFHDPDSELSQLNRANGAYVALSPLSIRVLRLARAMTLASKGLFNCTLGGALVNRGRLPCHMDRAYLPAGTADDIEVTPGHARLRRPLLVTLDGIAKGYAVDYAVVALRRQGVASGWVNAGGDLRAFGECVVPVHPRGASHRASFGLRNASLATSAGRAVYDVSLPGEILSPDLQPALGNWSVLAATAWRADALTKVAALAPQQQRDELLRKLGGRCAHFHDEEGTRAA